MKQFELSNLNVFYGWSVINKIRKKPALSVIFENEVNFSERKEKLINRLQKTFFIRKQTIDEAADGKHQNQILSEYSTFIFEKPFYGDINKVLEHNFQADINNVPYEVLVEIQSSLKKAFEQFYKQINKKL